MYCFKCGNQISDDSLFCSKCGISQTSNDLGKNKESNKDYSQEALRIYFQDLLSLECIKNKLQNVSNLLQISIKEKENSNYYQRYFLYTDRNIDRFLHLWYDGKETKFAAIKFSGFDPTVNGYQIDRRENLNYDNSLGYAVTEWLSVEKSRAIFETAWKYFDNSLFFGSVVRENKNLKKYCLEQCLNFEKKAPEKYKTALNEIEQLKDEFNGVTEELNNATKLLEQAYSVNIIPQQFRNIYAVYYLCDFVNTSNESLSTALLNYNLDIIKQKLDEIIDQQQEIIINQTLMMAQNEKLIKQNEQKIRYLASIEQNSDRASQYAQIAANNAEACAWISLANYIR